MTDPLLWILITIQMAFGVTDTLVHHEMTERLRGVRLRKMSCACTASEIFSIALSFY